MYFPHHQSLKFGFVLIIPTFALTVKLNLGRGELAFFLVILQADYQKI